MKQAKLTGLAHIGIKTQDIKKSIEFYTELGFTLDAEFDFGTKLGFMSLGTCLLELIEPADKAGLPVAEDGPVAHVAIECENIDALVANFKAKGFIDAGAEVKTSEHILDGIKNIFFRGPSNEYLELVEYHNR